MRTFARHILLPTFAVACVLVFAACHKGGQSETSPSPSSPGQTAISENQQSSKANQDEPSNALPREYPKTLPVFPGAQIEKVRKPKGSMREILFIAQAPFDQMIAFYKEQLIKNGYDITSALKIAVRKTWSCDFHRGGQQCSVMLFPNDADKSKMTIDLTYQMPSTVAVVPTLPQETFDVVGPGEPPLPNQPNNSKTNTMKGKTEKRKAS
jgi:hypothetical protein